MTSRVASALERIDARRELRAFVYVDQTAHGRGPIVAVKDNIDVRGMPTTAGGRHLPDAPRTRDAECVRRLRDAGCVLIGKTNLYEYAMGGTSHNEHFGDVRNPCDLRRDAGGSSSGSGAAVAGELCDAALGTDTLGSVRIPAAFCGVVGYKPPRSAIPRRGVFPNSPSLDAIGVLAPDVATAARIADLMRRAPVARVRLGRPSLAVPWSWLDGLTPEVLRAFRSVVDGLPDIALPARSAFGGPVFAVAQYESHEVHRLWLREAPERYGNELRELLAANARVSRREYDMARRECARLRRAVRRALATVDAIVVPTVPCVAPIRSRWPARERRLLSEWTRPFNVSDSPAIALPIPRAGLPVSLQIVANDEATAIAVASYMERSLSTRP